MTSFRRKYKNDSDLFCYICGEMTASKYRRKITDRIKKLYLAYLAYHSIIKEGVFVGPQIRKLILNKEFDKILHGNELDAWVSFKKVCTDFLGCHHSENFRDVIGEMLNTYKTLGCKMSLKVHFLDSHLDFFHKNMSDVSNEHGERFHQDISVIENRYKGKWSVSMLADCCWSIQRDDSETQHKRRRRY